MTLDFTFPVLNEENVGENGHEGVCIVILDQWAVVKLEDYFEKLAEEENEEDEPEEPEEPALPETYSCAGCTFINPYSLP